MITRRPTDKVLHGLVRDLLPGDLWVLNDEHRRPYWHEVGSVTLVSGGLAVIRGTSYEEWY